MADTPKKILVVDDTKNYVWVLEQALIGAGFIVATAGDGEEGLKAVAEEKPDLILLDITMPKMDGIAMANKLRETDKRTPIIFLTNMNDMQHISEGMQSSTDYVVKADTSTDDIIVKVKNKLNPQ